MTLADEIIQAYYFLNHFQKISGKTSFLNTFLNNLFEILARTLQKSVRL